MIDFLSNSDLNMYEWLIWYTSIISNIYFLIFFILIVSYLISQIIFFCNKSKQTFNKTYDYVFKLKFLLGLSYILVVILLIIVLILYIYYLQIMRIVTINTSFFSFFLFTIPAITSFFNLSIDLLGLILCILAFFVGLLSFYALDTRFYWNNTKFLLGCHLLCIIVFLYVSTNNLLNLFIFYECLLIPSFLFVYFVSPYRRSIQASLYFLIWTQFGSLLVLLAICYINYLTNELDLIKMHKIIFTEQENLIIFYLLFFGFGVKIPIWPFHHWLTKTHVEAPAGFSMFLSGFLVKSALYGFYKFTHLLNEEVFSLIALIILILGVMDASIKMWGQTDLKKLIAYGTIQEMNLIFIFFLWGNCSAIWGGIIFCITHSFLSGLLFYTVDCIQRRFHSRSIIELSGILQSHPNLGIIIFLNCILYSGLPGTLKFLSEIYLFFGFFENSFTLSLLVFFICNYLGFIGFCKCWYTVLFGMTVKNINITVDLTIKEALIIFFNYLILISFVFIDTYLMH